MVLKFATVVKLRPRVNRRDARQAIERILDSPESRVRDRSLYEGVRDGGFADFMIVGRVRRHEYAAITEDIVMPFVSPGDATVYLRTTETCTATSPNVMRFSFTDSVVLSTDETLPIALRTGEEHRRAFCGSVDKDVDHWLATHSVRASESAMAGLLRDVTAMLNLGADTEVVLGAVRLPCAPSADCPEAPAPNEYSEEGIKLPRLCTRCHERYEARVGDTILLGVQPPWSAEEDVDAVEAAVWLALRRAIDPDPTTLWINIVRDSCQGKAILRIKIHSSSGAWFYFRRADGEHEFIVRDGTRSVALSGPEADRYKAHHGRVWEG